MEERERNYIPYNYTIDVIWNAGDGEPVPIQYTNVSNIIVTHNYDNKKMPVIYMQCNISKSLLTRMIKDRLNSTIILSINKYQRSQDSISLSDNIQGYIKDEFIYFFDDDINYMDKVETGGGIDKRDDIYADVLIGLCKIKNINDDKRIMNSVIKQCTMTDIVLYYTSHMPLLLEPFDNDVLLKNFIIPPMSSISALLNYLDSKIALYKTPYRYYLDFDRTYLLSSAGVNTQAEDENINTIIIEIGDPSLLTTKSQGTALDNNIHIMKIDAGYTRYTIDDQSDNITNKLIGVDVYGNLLEANINVKRFKSSLDKYKIYRVDSFYALSMDKKKTEASAIQLVIEKNDIDVSIFTPNKEYMVNNHEDRQEYNGRYILKSKVEIFTREQRNFRSNSILKFNKVMDNIGDFGTFIDRTEADMDYMDSGMDEDEEKQLIEDGKEEDLFDIENEEDSEDTTNAEETTSNNDEEESE